MSIFHVFVENHVALLYILRRKFQNTLDYSVVRHSITSEAPVTTYPPTMLHTRSLSKINLLRD